MKNKGIILVAVFALLHLYCSLYASMTTPEQAEKVVRGWLKADANPLNTSLGQQVKVVETFTNDAGQPIYYIVYLQPNGFVIVSADDLIEPIIGFTQENIYDPSPANPLGALVTNDLRGRIVLARAGIPARTKAVTGVTTEPQSKWNTFLGLAESQQNDIGTLGLPSIDDVRVSPLVQSRWHQTTCCSSPALACYNYYTYPYYEGGDGKFNYPCGCVATALAQIMRYHQWPNTGIGTGPPPDGFWITINSGDPESHHTRGGDGEGGSYNWNQMPLVPNSICGTITEAQRQAIGNLCYDAGVGISNLASDAYYPDQYTNYSYNVTVAFTHSAKVGLISTFNYSNAIYGFNGNSNIGEGLIGMVNPNLDTGLPVCFGIKAGGSTGHEVVCDGYGYNTGTMYHHLNMGWAGSQDAWYNLPNINSFPTSYSSVYETIYNIYKTGDGEIMSGRVTDPSGNPISNVRVDQYLDDGGPFHVIVTRYTNANGIYAFRGIDSDSDFVVSAKKDGYIFPNPITVHTEHSSDMQSTSGNLWGIDFVCIPPDVNSIAPTFGPPGTYMKIQGNDFGDSSGNVIFTSDGSHGEILQWSDNLILCRVPYGPTSGDVIVQSSVGVNSEGVYFDVTDPSTIYVDVNYTPDVENGSTDYPFSEIGRGIYAATTQDNVIVKPGTYYENVDFDGRVVTLTSTDPTDPNIVSSTIIDGGQNDPVVTFWFISDPNCSLHGFTITNGSSGSEGGGIYCCQSNPQISHCIISNNTCIDGAGGGMYVVQDFCNPTVSHCTFIGNSASYGGGLGTWQGVPTVKNCTFIDNSADYGGGGLFLNADSDSPVSNCTFIRNSVDPTYSSGKGGGLLTLTSSPTVVNCIFRQNSCQYWGGGVCSDMATPEFTNCLIIDNFSNDNGGGMCNAASDSVLTNCTFSKNLATNYGDGIYNREKHPVLTNCILWENGDYEIYGSSSTINYSDIKGGWTGAGSNNINSDPNFIDPDNADPNLWDFRLRFNSPCIDAGDPNYVPELNETDMDSQPRIVGCRIDIGADEFVYPGDIEFDGDVDLVDFAIFAGFWQDTNCGTCGGADFTGNEIVDANDLSVLTENWLKSLCRN